MTREACPVPFIVVESHPCDGMRQGAWVGNRSLRVTGLTRMRPPFVKRQITPVSGRFSFFSAFQGLAQSTVGRVF
jgi:hypothetical protein